MMYSDKWEVIVQEEIGSWRVKVFLVCRGERARLAHIKNGFIELEEIKSGQTEADPTFVMDLDVWKALGQAMTEKVEKDKNNLYGELSHIQGELTATKYHLEDMRKLAGVVPTIINQMKKTEE